MLLIYVLGVSCPVISGLFSIWQQSVNLLHLLIYPPSRKWLMVRPGARLNQMDVISTKLCSPHFMMLLEISCLRLGSILEIDDSLVPKTRRKVLEVV